MRLGKQEDLLKVTSAALTLCCVAVSLLTICAWWLSLCACSFLALPHIAGSTTCAIFKTVC